VLLTTRLSRAAGIFWEDCREDLFMDREEILDPFCREDSFFFGLIDFMLYSTNAGYFSVWILMGKRYGNSLLRSLC
jgi:hypothetical protein